jgi:hypothetical protein
MSNLRLIENRIQRDNVTSDNLIPSSNIGTLSPKMDLMSEIFQGELDLRDSPKKTSVFDPHRIARKVNNSVDFGNQEDGKKKIAFGKRLKAKDHMISFKEIKASEFTQAKLTMRNVKEERERILGP